MIISFLFVFLFDLKNKRSLYVSACTVIMNLVLTINAIKAHKLYNCLYCISNWKQCNSCQCLCRNLNLNRIDWIYCEGQLIWNTLGSHVRCLLVLLRIFAENLFEHTHTLTHRRFVNFMVDYPLWWLFGMLMLLTLKEKNHARRILVYIHLQQFIAPFFQKKRKNNKCKKSTWRNAINDSFSDDFGEMTISLCDEFHWKAVFICRSSGSEELFHCHFVCKLNRWM